MYEGPFYWGKHRWSLPTTPDFWDEAFYTTSAAEGHLEAVNFYDRAICTVGALQWADFAPQFSVMKLLGHVASKHSDSQFVQNTLVPALKASNASFEPRPDGQWRFFIGEQEVNTQALQHKLYHGGSSGRVGGWTAKQKAHAKLWAACLATVFENVEAQTLQAEFTKPRLIGFVSSYAKSVLFNDSDPTLASADMRLVKLLRAAYVSFAVNNPTWASSALKKAADSSSNVKWSLGYIVDVLRELVYARGIGIYPARYNTIRPILEKLYGVDVPDKAVHLGQKNVIADASGGLFAGLKDVQAALNALGYDAGKVDGVPGPRTVAAIKAFEAANRELTVDGLLDSATVAAIAKAERERTTIAAPVVPQPVVAGPEPVSVVEEQPQPEAVSPAADEEASDETADEPSSVLQKEDDVTNNEAMIVVQEEPTEKQDVFSLIIAFVMKLIKTLLEHLAKKGDKG